MSLIPIKELELQGEWLIEEMVVFDAAHFPNVFLIKKKITTVTTPPTTSKYYLFDMVKGKDIYMFPRENYPFSTTYESITNKMIYDSNTQILTYMSNLPVSNGQPKMVLEKFKLSYENYKFQTKTLNTIEIPNVSGCKLRQLPKSNYMICYKTGYQPNNCCNIVIFDFNSLEIIMEYTDKAYYDTLSSYIPGIVLIYNQSELVIYDYLNNRELDTIVSRYSPARAIHIEFKVNTRYFIIKDGATTTFYKFIDEETLPSDEKCVICFSKTDRKSALVPCGHTQLCATCVKKKLETCPLCREPIEKVIKLY